MGLDHQVAIVTGAASETGQAYVKHLLLNRVKVLLCDVNVEKCQIIAEQFSKEFQNVSTLSTKCDVTDEEEFESTFKTCMKHFGRLDIVINNAGVFNDSPERWSTTVNTNYGGVVKGTLLAIKYMGIPNGGNGGTVIQTTSLMAFSDSSHLTPMYKSTRKCVTDFTKSFGEKRNFSLHGVKIISLCPGFTNVNFYGPAATGTTETDSDYEVRVAELEDVNKQLILKKPDHLGSALIEILEHGQTGETWIVEDNKPPRLVDY